MDASIIARLVIAVVSIFNLNSIQEKELNDYVKQKESEWIHAMKSEQEIEELIKNQAEYISKN